MQRQPANAPVTVCVYKITDCAGDIWSEQEGKEVALSKYQGKMILVVNVASR